MAQQKVDAVIGGYGSQLVQAQSVVPERYGIPFVAGGKLRKPLKIALVTENTEHGRDYVQGVKDYIKAHPGTFSVALEESFEYNNTADFRPVLTRVESAKADLFMADAHLEDYIAMHRTYTQMGLQHQMVTYGARGADAAG